MSSMRTMSGIRNTINDTYGNIRMVNSDMYAIQNVFFGATFKRRW